MNRYLFPEMAYFLFWLMALGAVLGFHVHKLVNWLDERRNKK